MKKKLIHMILFAMVIGIVLVPSGLAYADTQAEVKTEEEAPDSTVEQEQPVKISIDTLTVTLDSYMAMATGNEVTPKILSVRGTITETAEDGEKEIQKEVVLKPEEYEVKYYRVLSFSDKIYEEVKAISEVGEYKIAVAAKDTETYEGEAYSLFSVVGKPQKLTIAKTKYTLTVGSKGPLLQPNTDGDGSGFTFESSDKSVVSVSAAGRTEILKPGRALVTIYTKGTTLYQPAKVQVVFEVKPGKVVWDTKKMKKQKSSKTLRWKKQTGITKYEVVYSTSKDFKKAVKTKTVKGSLTKTTLKNLKKLKKDGKYYIKVRALTETTDTRGNKRTMEGPWSAVRKITV